MTIKRKIRNALWITAGLAGGALALVLLLSAIRNKDQKTCEGLAIDIDAHGDLFIDKKEIVEMITSHGSIPVRGRAIKSFDLQGMEERLRKDSWVKDAELYFDSRAVLHVRVEERVPIARIFPLAGTSFYIDTSCSRLPISEKMTTRLPVFTSLPNNADSSLMQEVKQMALVIANDSFWTAQVVQVDITPAHEFELVPLLGNHIIEFGDAAMAADKFHRLMVFYKQVLSKTGFEKYKRISVKYDRQIIGVKSLNIDSVVRSPVPTSEKPPIKRERLTRREVPLPHPSSKTTTARKPKAVMERRRD